MYGDAGDDNFLSEIKAEESRLIISTIPDLAVSLNLLSYLRGRAFQGVAVVSVHQEAEAERCYEAGATFVIVPAVLSGERFRDLLVEKKTRKLSWETLAKNKRTEFLPHGL